MELEIYEALISAGVKEDKAKAAVESINKEIDKRYTLHADQLATRGDTETIRRDMAEMETRLTKLMSDNQKWTIASMFAAIGIFATLIKVLS